MEKSTSRIQPRWITRKISPLSLIGGSVRNVTQTIVAGRVSTDSDASCNNNVSSKVKDSTDGGMLHTTVSLPAVNAVNERNNGRMDNELFTRLRARRVMMEKLEGTMLNLLSLLLLECDGVTCVSRGG
jgi:hypothetical protein